jgi:hypothetical protein
VNLYDRRLAVACLQRNINPAVPGLSQNLVDPAIKVSPQRLGIATMHP